MALMLATRMCRAPAFKQGLNLTKQLQLRSALVRNYAEDSRDALARAARKRATLKERAMAPAGPTGKKINITEG